MATSALSDTLCCGDSDSELRGVGGTPWIGAAPEGVGGTHQWCWGDPGVLAQACLRLLVVAVELHAILGVSQGGVVV